MAFDFWRFMSSPHGTASPSRQSRRRKTDKPGVPWFISATFFVGVLGVLAGALVLLALSVGLNDAMPGWFDALILVHGAALIGTLVFVLNGFGWARLAWVVLCLAQLAFDQGIVTRYFLIFDLTVLVVLVLPASNRYMTACAAARHGPRD